MKFFILGHGRHGKDTVAELLRRLRGFTFVSSSWFVMEKAVWPVLREKYKYNCLNECFADRSNHRQEWYDLIAGYNRDDPARLSRELFARYHMYVGIRRREEYLAARQLADLSIWVNASKRLPPEPSSSMTILRSDCDIVIDNNGTLEELEQRVQRLEGVLR